MPAVRVLLIGLLLLPNTGRAAHPLITEDTGTQGRGKFQLELTTEHIGTRRHGNSQAPVVLTTTTMSLGLHDTLDAIFTIPHLRFGQSTPGGAPGNHGLADTGLDLKWRFH